MGVPWNLAEDERKARPHTSLLACPVISLAERTKEKDRNTCVPLHLSQGTMQLAAWLQMVISFLCGVKGLHRGEWSELLSPHSSSSTKKSKLNLCWFLLSTFKFIPSVSDKYVPDILVHRWGSPTWYCYIDGLQSVYRTADCMESNVCAWIPIDFATHSTGAVTPNF